MIKDILNELILKNSENLSQHNFERNTVLGMNRDLDKLKINDDISNEDIIVDEHSSKITNAYVELKDVVENKDKYEISKDDKNKVDLNSLTLNKE
ncbi:MULTISPECIES: hypothetical protein [Clostridium]|uniref:Uncharacterized protein n=1 Tax=Clostridium tertium TaxID=1559 RepID=A0A9X3XFX6_9CLOT|nr:MULTISPECIES: hypothetical protein [Clostridium]MDB1931871.1 hypothetical protein [Clostridium tertium]MDB1935495.1 hypothetical protein [Clostridium tertium]MDB1953341.1 hypothetical protein [Clostridium tertium]MDB1959597.1 hypothetical protein [Clostridium tertium]MDB1963486.1 hypothetical protein [Clostridium tertium]